MKIGVVGTGNIAREVIPLLPRCGWEVAALCGTPRSRATAEALCADYQIPKRFCDYGEFLGQSEIETVYIAVPNFLHYSFAAQALEAGRNVILEKPLTSNSSEAEKLAALARENNRFLFEAISTIHLPNYKTLQRLLARIGDIKIASCNFSQYSSRYDAFQAGETPPVFDPAKSGGTLMDLNLYNLHYMLGLFGAPESVQYHANMARGIDTSGVISLKYNNFQGVCIAAKDCAAPCSCVIQGTKGYLCQSTPANQCGAVTLHLNDGTEERYDESPDSRLEPEFRVFAREIASGDRTICDQLLDHSLLVSRVLTEARLSAGIYFPTDHKLE